MKILYAPWRADYSSDVHEGKDERTSADACVFCKQFARQDDEKYFIVRRFKHTVVMLNKYPYNAGHVLIMPLTHVGSLPHLSPPERVDLIEVISLSTDVIKNSLKADGLNVGLNLGKAAGAGIPSHLHVHVIPRWTGDTNFMPIVGRTKVISFDVGEIYETLRAAFSGI